MLASAVLVIDSDPTTSAIFCGVIQALGLRPLPATKTADALERFREANPVVVILDVGPQGGAAREVFDHFARGRQVPVIAVAEAATVRAAVDAMRVGAVDVVEKRCSAEE